MMLSRFPETLSMFAGFYIIKSIPFFLFSTSILGFMWRWKMPLRDLTTESVPIADLRYSVHKLLRILHTNDFVIAF